MRVCGERCGLWRRGFETVKEKVLSLEGKRSVNTV